MGKDLKGKELGKGFSQRKDGSYNFRFTDRLGNRVSLYDKSFSKLKKEASIAISEDKLNLSIHGKDKTLNELFDDAMTVYRVDELKENTILSYTQAYDRYVRDGIGKCKISKVTPKDIKMTFNNLGNKYSQSICGTVRACFLNIYDVAVIEGIVPYNIIHSLKVKSKRETKIVESLTLEEQKLFLECANSSFYYNLYVFIFNSGLRVGEAIGLSINDIDLEKKVLYVKRALYYRQSKGVYSNGSKYKFEKPKNNSIRTVPINDTLYDIIIDQMYVLNALKKNRLQTNNKPYQKIEEFDDLLFLSRTGTPMSRASINSDITRVIKLMRKKDKNIKQFGVHALRHTFATRCYEAGMKETTLQTIMGHKKLAVTMDTYVTKELAYDSTQLIDCLFTKNSNSINGVELAYEQKIN